MTGGDSPSWHQAGCSLSSTYTMLCGGGRGMIERDRPRGQSMGYQVGPQGWGTRTYFRRTACTRYVRVYALRRAGIFKVRPCGRPFTTILTSMPR